MTDIIAEYERREAEAGGLKSPSCDPKAIIAAIARDCELPLAEVRRAMLDHWTQAGSG